MPFSYNSYTGDNSTTEFAITFNYLPDTIVVSTDPKGIEVHLNGVKQTGGYTINTSTNKVNFASAPATGQGISILRVTPRGKNDRLVDFSDGTIITEAQLDTVALQLLYIAQEAFEQSNSGGSAAPTYLSYDEVNGYWDALYGAATQTIRNLKLPEADSEAASKKYVDDVATWGISGVPQQWTFTGTGSLDIFTLTAGPNIEEEMLVVSIDGALQIPNTDFSVIQGATDSTLDFDTAPGNGTVINVQNFGKKRFLDGLDISDGSVTTAKLDQTVSTEAVSTATIRDDAVTAAKIADSSVDFARMNASTFTTATGDSTPRFISVPVSGTGLSLGTLSTASIVDFNTNVNAKKLSDFQPPTAAVSMGTQKITNLVDPTSNQEAATKKYVDDELLSTNNSGVVRLGVYSLGSKSPEFEISNWYSTDYTDYEFHCVGFTTDDDAGGALIGMLFADSTGSYQTNNDDYLQFHRVSSLESASVLQGTVINGRMAQACPFDSDGTSTQHRQMFKLWLPGNRTAFGFNKHVISEGYGFARSTGSGAVGNNEFSHYRIVNRFQHSTGVITKIKFISTDSISDTSYSADIASNARVIVYGRKHS